MTLKTNKYEWPAHMLNTSKQKKNGNLNHNEIGLNIVRMVRTRKTENTVY